MYILFIRIGTKLNKIVMSLKSNFKKKMNLEKMKLRIKIFIKNKKLNGN